MQDSSTQTQAQIRDATIGDLDRLVQLFDAYRKDYAQSSEPEQARAFLQARMTNGDSRIFVAAVDNVIVGFVQLYPLLSSMAMQSVWLLNDIFVDQSARGGGVAAELLKHAERFAADSGACRLELATARDNRAAQALYEKHGWIQDEIFLHFFRPIDRA